VIPVVATPRVLPTVDLHAAVRVVSAICPWCEKPRRLDRVGYLIAHRSQRVKGWLPSGRLRIYVGRDECPGSGERRGETKAADET
jgi:hypothetical protein